MGHWTSLTRKSLVKNVISIWGSLTRKFPVKGVPNHFAWKRQNGTIFVVSRIPSKWYQNDTKMNTKWYQTDTKMKPKWYHNEFKLTAKWYQNDTMMNSKWNQNGIKMIAKCLQNVLQARSGHNNTYHISILFPNIDFTFVTWATVATYQRWTHIVCCVRRVNSQHNMKFTGPATTKHSQRNRASRSMSSQVLS